MTDAMHQVLIVEDDPAIVDLGLPDRDDSGSLRVYIASLRRKLEADPSRPRHIITELGLGYRLVLDQEAGMVGAVD